MKINGMFDNAFGIEIEFTGITRATAASVSASFLNGTVSRNYDHYDTYLVTTPDSRVWKFMSDSSIHCQRRINDEKIDAGPEYSVELVSPILYYRDDIENLQELIRKLHRSGAFATRTCGIHIHIDGKRHTPSSLRNFINIIASKNDLFYKALQIPPERMLYCKKLDNYLVNRMNEKKPKTMKDISEIWYEEYDEDRGRRYHSSRYNILNLHPLFSGRHTIEFRGFNTSDEKGSLNAGKIRAYIVLVLALNNQALTQKYANPKKCQSDNEKFAMRTYLKRIGLNGNEFKNCREYLCSPLMGNSTWRYQTA